MEDRELLAPHQVLDLAVLGVTSERALSAVQIIGVVQRVGGARFRPTSEVIADRVASLADAGLLVAEPGAAGRHVGSHVGRHVAWRSSRAGRAQVQRLLLRGGGAPDAALAGVCAALRICFLDMLDPELRGAVLDDLLAAHRRARDQAQAALGGCPCRCPLVQRCLARDVERWEAEIAWLEGLRFEVEVGARPAAIA